jgi:hypothetical protein
VRPVRVGRATEILRPEVTDVAVGARRMAISAWARPNAASRLASSRSCSPSRSSRCFHAIPKIASYSEVWTEIKDMTPLEIGFLLAATALNLVTYWWANMVSIPNLGLWQAAVNNQTSTTVANTMPGVVTSRSRSATNVSRGASRRRTSACRSP